MRNRILLLLTGVNLVYLLLGGLIYHKIELPRERDRIQASRDVRKNVIDTFLVNRTCVSEGELESLIDLVVGEVTSGNLRSTDDELREAWGYADAVLFSAVVITTVGYGQLTPKTVGGRIFTVFYALLGIPLCLTMLAVVGAKLGHLSHRIDRCLDKGWLPRCGHVVRVLLIVGTGFLLFILFPALIVEKVERWSYSEAVYYGVVTLTTVGFGDFVAGTGKERNWFYRMSVVCWILIGLAWCSTVINSFQELYTASIYPADDEDGKEDDEAPTVMSGSSDGCVRPARLMRTRSSEDISPGELIDRKDGHTRSDNIFQTTCNM